MPFNLNTMDVERKLFLLSQSGWKHRTSYNIKLIEANISVFMPQFGAYFCHLHLPFGFLVTATAVSVSRVSALVQLISHTLKDNSFGFTKSCMAMMAQDQNQAGNNPPPHTCTSMSTPMDPQTSPSRNPTTLNLLLHATMLKKIRSLSS